MIQVLPKRVNLEDHVPSCSFGKDGCRHGPYSHSARAQWRTRLRPGKQARMPGTSSSVENIFEMLNCYILHQTRLVNIALENLDQEVRSRTLYHWVGKTLRFQYYTCHNGSRCWTTGILLTLGSVSRTEANLGEVNEKDGNTSSHSDNGSHHSSCTPDTQCGEHIWKVEWPNLTMQSARER